MGNFDLETIFLGWIVLNWNFYHNYVLEGIVKPATVKILNHQIRVKYFQKQNKQTTLKIKLLLFFFMACQLFLRINIILFLILIKNNIYIMFKESIMSFII